MLDSDLIWRIKLILFKVKNSCCQDGIGGLNTPKASMGLIIKITNLWFKLNSICDF